MITQRRPKKTAKFTVYSIQVGDKTWYDITHCPDALQRYFRKEYLNGATGWPYDEWRAAELVRFDIVVRWLVWPLRSPSEANAIAAYLTLGRIHGWTESELLNDIDDWRRSQVVGDNG